jgi:GDP-4-dehydro-6-deoxy-D-mannose reductase
MRILVTGATGFVGRHLLAELKRQPDVTLFALDRAPSAPVHGLQPLVVDLLDRPALQRSLAEIQPESVYHLAGFASPARALKEPLAAWEGNLTTTLNLFEAVIAVGLRPRILAVGSGLIYGNQPPEVRLNEETQLRPNNPYSASKAAADLAGFQYFADPGLPILRVRPFNHLGPGQSPEYAVSSFARQVVAIERGEQPPVLETGNLQHRRDFTDVRDVCRAYTLLMERGQPGEVYNIASGSTVTMREVVDLLIQISGLRVEVRARADLVRAVDLSVPAVDISRLRSATNWRPQIPLEQTLHDVLEGWRSVPSSNRPT